MGVKTLLLNNVTTFTSVLLFLFSPLQASAQECFHPDGQPYKNHWEACNVTLIIEYLGRTQAEAILWNFGCDAQTTFQDDNGLWKPVSENTGKPVVLLPSYYWDEAKSIELYTSAGTKLADVARRRCCPNGDRAHYDVPIKAEEIAPYARLVITFENDYKECRIIPDPTRRQE